MVKEVWKEVSYAKLLLVCVGLGVLVAETQSDDLYDQDLSVYVVFIEVLDLVEPKEISLGVQLLAVDVEVDLFEEFAHCLAINEALL